MVEPLTPERLAELRMIANEATLTVGIEASQIVQAMMRFWDVFDPLTVLRLLDEIRDLNLDLEDANYSAMEEGERDCG